MDTDPDSVRTASQLAIALERLRSDRGLSYRDLERAARALPGGRRLPTSTVSDALARGTPSPDTLRTLLTVLGVPRAETARWLAARDRALAAGRRASGPVLTARTADPRRLGIHSAITVPGVSDDTLPAYVERDIDGDEFGVRARLRDAAAAGGFVLLIGPSSAGKSRSAYEAIRGLIPDWPIVHPARSGSEPLDDVLDRVSGKTVVWLDELQFYLGGDHGLTPAAVRRLLDAAEPIVVIGTLWPDLYRAYTARPRFDQPDPYARHREILALARTVRINAELSRDEQARADTTARADPRLRIALESPDYGMTQTLAAAPELVARWQDAPETSPYGWAASALIAAAGSPMGQVTGYLPADYLRQYAARVRHSALVPRSTWDALVAHHPDPEDAVRLAAGARDRLLLDHAEAFYGRAASPDVDDHVGLLLERGRVASAEALLHASDDANALWWLAELRLSAGAPDEACALRRRAALIGDSSVALVHVERLLMAGRYDDAVELLEHRDERDYLVGLLHGRGDTARLAVLAAQGSIPAVRALAALRAADGDTSAAVALLADHPADAEAVRDLVRLHLAAGRRPQALRLLRRKFGPGSFEARAGQRLGWEHELPGGRLIAAALVEHLLTHGAPDRALAVLRARAEHGDPWASARYADALVMAGRLDELREATDEVCTDRYARYLYETGDGEALAERARAGDEAARAWLPALLAARGDVAALRRLAKHGNSAAADWLLGHLVDHGDVSGLEELAGSGVPDAAAHLVDVRFRCEDADGLRRRADTGDGRAGWRLAQLLAARGDADGLRSRIDRGDSEASAGLITLLTRQNDVAALEAETTIGTPGAARALLTVLDAIAPARADALRMSGL